MSNRSLTCIVAFIIGLLAGCADSSFSLTLNGGAGVCFTSDFTRSTGAPGSVLESTGQTAFLFNLPATPNASLMSVTVDVYRTFGNGGIPHMRIDAVSKDGITTLGVAMAANPASLAWTTLSIPVSGETIGNRSLQLIIHTSAAGIAFGNIVVQYSPSGQLVSQLPELF